MTDDEKVKTMFDIRCKEMPGYEDVAKRMATVLFDKENYTVYNSMLKMYNERFGESGAGTVISETTVSPRLTTANAPSEDWHVC